jgi:hypothetical protein
MLCRGKRGYTQAIYMFWKYFRFNDKNKDKKGIPKERPNGKIAKGDISV